jgi:hypothetical protein
MSIQAYRAQGINASTNSPTQKKSIHPEHGTLTIAPISGKYFLQLR